MEPRIISSLGDDNPFFGFINKKKRGKKYGNHPACEGRVSSDKRGASGDQTLMEVLLYPSCVKC